MSRRSSSCLPRTSPGGNRPACRSRSSRASGRGRAPRTASRGRCSRRSTRSSPTSDSNMGPSSAGAIGWMQFMPSTWERWGMDANGDGVSDPWNPDDAIFAAARYLAAAGGRTDIARGIFAYNHAQWYVDEILGLARLYGQNGFDITFTYDRNQANAPGCRDGDRDAEPRRRPRHPPGAAARPSDTASCTPGPMRLRCSRAGWRSRSAPSRSARGGTQRRRRSPPRNGS